MSSVLPVRTFCIVIPEFPEKTSWSQEHFKEIGLEVDFVDGIYAEKAGLSTAHHYEIDGPGYTIPPKHVGIVLSNYMLWTMCYRLPEDYFFILENDAVFQPTAIARIKAALELLPADWDLFYPGSCCCHDKPITHVVGELYTVPGLNCNHAYMIRKKAIPVLLAAHRKIWAPLDIAMCFESHPHLRVYTLLPRAVDQRENYLLQ